MNKKEENEKIEKIIKSGKYLECRIVFDANNPFEAITCLVGNKFSNKVMYSMLLSLREMEKIILNKHPELRITDMFTDYNSEIENVYEKEDSIHSFMTEILRKMGKEMEEK